MSWLIFFWPFPMKIYMCSSYEWMHEGQRVSWARRQEQGGLSWSMEETGLMMVARPFTGPFHIPWSPTTDQTKLNSQCRLLWQQVPTGRQAKSYGIRYSPSHRRHSVCLLLCILSSATGPTACTSCHDLFKCTSLLWRLIKTLHGTSDVIVYAGRSVFTA